MPNTRHVQTFTAALPVAAAVLIGLLALVYALSGDNFLLNILAVSFLYAGLSMSWNIIGGFG
ncbi:MAG: hypothetical protein KDJ29_20840, partial [Hyphomicrobiales bacterium]|nr:hypothetical protein [Hyphomicrobiales bacterium]